MKYLFLLLLLAGNVCSAQEVTKSVSKNTVFIDLIPLSKYDMGRCAKLLVGIQTKQHEWYAGLSTHIGNASKEYYSNTNDITHNNGYTGRLLDYFHPNVGYVRLFKPKAAITPYFYADLVGGSIMLGNRFYGYGLDSVGNPIGISQYSPAVATKSAKYLQLSIGVGAQIHMNSRLVLLNHIGVGESIIIYQYSPVPNITYREGTINHFVLNYSVGLQYSFK